MNDRIYVACRAEPEFVWKKTSGRELSIRPDCRALTMLTNVGTDLPDPVDRQRETDQYLKQRSVADHTGHETSPFHCA